MAAVIAAAKIQSRVLIVMYPAKSCLNGRGHGTERTPAMSKIGSEAWQTLTIRRKILVLSILRTHLELIYNRISFPDQDLRNFKVAREESESRAVLVNTVRFEVSKSDLGRIPHFVGQALTR